MLLSLCLEISKINPSWNIYKIHMTLQNPTACNLNTLKLCCFFLSLALRVKLQHSIVCTKPQQSLIFHWIGFKCVLNIQEPL